MERSDTIEVPLTKGYVALIDATDAWVLNYRWHALVLKHGVYAVRNLSKAEAEAEAAGGRGTAYMHRQIMDAGDRRKIVDHIDGGTLDNRRANLRVVTTSINGQNRGSPPSDNKSGHMGVHWFKLKRRWCASIRINNKTRFIGYFRDVEDAARARGLAEVRLIGVSPRREEALRAIGAIQ